MINEDRIASMLEGFNLKPDQIDEIMIQLHDVKPDEVYNLTPTWDIHAEELLKGEMMSEKDWRKKAAMAAKIISMRLEDNDGKLFS